MDIEYYLQDGERVVYEFPILYQGWDMDDVGWITKNKYGSKRILSTNHGRVIELDDRDLLEKISQYNSAIEETVMALDILKEK
jgi:hypothetical protein